MMQCKNSLQHRRILPQPIFKSNPLVLERASRQRRRVLSAAGPNSTLQTQFSSISLPQLDAVDLANAKESLQQSSGVAQQYAGKAAAMLAGAWSNLLQPFAVFGDAWVLNVLFFATLGLLAYSLLVLAPK